MSSSVKGAGGGENLKAEVQAQVPIVRQIMDNFKITGDTTGVAGNKAQLQQNNENLALIKELQLGNAKPENVEAGFTFSSEDGVNLTGTGGLNLENGVLHENLLALENIEKNNFVSFQETGKKDKIDTLLSASFTPSPRNRRFCKLSDELYILISGGIAILFKFDGVNLIKGTEVRISGGEHYTAPAVSPDGTGIVYAYGSGSYGYRYLSYLKVNPATLEVTQTKITLPEQGRVYMQGKCEFIDKRKECRWHD